MWNYLNLSFHCCSKIPLIVPPCEIPPASWWDSEADKSLLIGSHRHGFERHAHTLYAKS